MHMTFSPLPIFPNATARRRRSQFSAGYASTLQILERELRHLGADDIRLQAGFHDQDIRLDGLPRSGSRPNHPGVILSFRSKHGDLNYPCDCFDQWEDNVRAIALSLEHLRLVDRYGVTKRGEQYSGWKALPPPNGPPPMTAAQAGRFIHENSGGMPVETREQFDAAYREAAKRLHPDRGGDAKLFVRLQEAKEALQ